MQRKYFLCVIAYLYCALASGAEFRRMTTDAGVVPNEYIVVFKRDKGIIDDESSISHDRKSKESPGELLGQLSHTAYGHANRLMSGIKSSKRRAPIANEIDDKLHTVYTSGFNGFHARLSARGLANVLNDDAVDYVVPNITTHVLDAVEPASNWGADRIDQHLLPLDNLYHYGASGVGVNVIVLDSGINTSHQAFAGRIVGGYNFLNNSSNYEDDNGHGTRMAGIIGGKTGIAKNVNFYIGKVAGSDGTGSLATLITGIQWAIQLNLPKSIVNVSIGSETQGWSQPLSNVIQKARSLGIGIVAGAGNKGTDTCLDIIPRALRFSDSSFYYRTEYGQVAGATDANDRWLGGTNFSGCITIFAPGTGIRAPTIGSNNPYAYSSGTSTSAAFTTGGLALAREIFSLVKSEYEINNTGFLVWSPPSQLQNPNLSQVDSGALGSSRGLLYIGNISGGYTGSVPPVCLSNCTGSGSGTGTGTGTGSGSGTGTGTGGVTQSALQKLIAPFLYIFK